MEPSLAALDAALEQLAAQADHAGEDLSHRIRAGQVRLRRERDRLAASLARGRRRREGLPAWGSLVNWARPRGQPQDRVMSLFQAIWEHGPGLADTLVEAAGTVMPGVGAVVPLDR